MINDLMKIIFLKKMIWIIFLILHVLLSGNVLGPSKNCFERISSGKQQIIELATFWDDGKVVLPMLIPPPQKKMAL